MAKIQNIVIHCSDSTWGNAIEIEKWHKKRGWSGIGYHEVILNGKIRSAVYNKDFDGVLESGRPYDNDDFIDSKEAGAHAYGINSKSIGIVLIGKNTFTREQFLTLIERVAVLTKRYGLSFDNVVGHYEHDSRKSCPNINMPKFREGLKSLKLV